MDGRDSPKRRLARLAGNDPRRLHLQDIARTTIEALNNGFIDEPSPAAANTVLRHDIRRLVTATKTYTKLYPDNSPELKDWRTPPPIPLALPGASPVMPVKIDLRSASTIEGARHLRRQFPNAKIGVLSFASATKPGGGFINGARAQEESIARSSSLYASLASDAAKPFYVSHGRDEKGGYYTHAMIHSPNVVIFRDDDGQWLKPIRVDVVTSPAVNAGKVRKTSRRSRDEVEGRIQEVMKERMARILTVFERQGVRNLVLGSFGTGVFQNDVQAMAEIWRELLTDHHARFKMSFDNVVFAIPDHHTLAKFRSGFIPYVRHGHL